MQGFLFSTGHHKCQISSAWRASKSYFLFASSPTLGILHGLWRKNGLECVSKRKKNLYVYIYIYTYTISRSMMVFILLHSDRADRTRLVQRLLKSVQIRRNRWMEIWRRFKSRIVQMILRIRMNFTKRRYVIKMYTHFSRTSRGSYANSRIQRV